MRLRRPRVLHLVMPFLGFLVVPASLGATEVFLRSDEIRSQGVTKEEDGRCFVVTVAHGLSEDGRATILGANGTVVRGERIDALPMDLAVLEAIYGADSSFQCEEAGWRTILDTEAALDQFNSGVLRLRTEVGTSARIPVDIVYSDDKSVRVRPKAQVDSIMGSMSGASLVIGDVLVGLLVAAEDGSGRVVRLDYLKSALEALFGPGQACPRGCVTALGEANLVAEYSHDLMDGFEEVYRLPEGWPAPPYVHLIGSSLYYLESIRMIVLGFGSEPLAGEVKVYDWHLDELFRMAAWDSLRSEVAKQYEENWGQYVLWREGRVGGDYLWEGDRFRLELLNVDGDMRLRVQSLGEESVPQESLWERIAVPPLDKMGQRELLWRELRDLRRQKDDLEDELPNSFDELERLEEEAAEGEAFCEKAGRRGDQEECARGAAARGRAIGVVKRIAWITERIERLDKEIDVVKGEFLQVTEE